MPYTQTTWAQLKTELFRRLGNSVFWTDDATVYSEAASCLREAMRVWAVTSHYWKQRVLFSTAASTAWYDLESVTTQPAGIFTRTVQDRHLLAEMQYHLLEPVSFSSWGSEQFTFAEAQAAIEARRDIFLMETALILSRRVLNFPASPEGRIEISTDSNGKPVIDIRRLAWIAATTSRYTQLWRDDEWATQSYQPGWTQQPQDPPRGYSVALTPPLQVQLIPPPLASGQLEMIASHAGATLDTATGVLLGVPDNFSWVIKWGAMADLLAKEGPGQDVLRAMYCEQRWQDGVELAREYSTVMALRINDVPVSVESVQAIDSARPNWQSQSGRPDIAGLSGGLIALGPVADGVYSVSVDAMIPAPIPATDGDNVQIGSDEIDAILEEAQHIAAFKQGGQEFAASITRHKAFLECAATHNERLRASAIYGRVLSDRQKQELERRPHRKAGSPVRV